MRTSFGNGTIGNMTEADLGNRLWMSIAKAVGARNWFAYCHVYCSAGVGSARAIGYGWLNSVALPCVVISCNGTAVLAGAWRAIQY